MDIILSFPRIKQLCDQREVVVAALRKSAHLTVSKDGRKVSRKDPHQVQETLYRRVLITHLPSSLATADGVKGIVGKYGEVVVVEISEGEDSHQMATVEFGDAESAYQVRSGGGGGGDGRNRSCCCGSGGGGSRSI